MIEYNLDTEHSILHVQPKSAIEQDDFVETREGGRPAHRGNRRSCRSHHRNPVVPRMEESWGNGQPVSLCPRSSQAHKENRSRNGLPPGRCRRAFNVTLCISGDQAFPRRADRGSTTMDHERLMMRRGVSDTASSPPATDAATPGTTGMAALTQMVTGPLTGSSPGINPSFSSAPSRGCERTAAASGSRRSRRR